MKILHVSRTPCAGAIHALSTAVTDYTEHASKWAGLSGDVGLLGFPPPDISLHDTGFLWELHDADVIVLHNYLSTEEQPIADFLLGDCTKRVAAFYHSHPVDVNLQPVEAGFASFCAAQYQALLYDGARAIRSVIRFDRADWPRRLSSDERSFRIGYSPSVRIPQEGRKPDPGWYRSKGFAETLKVLEKLEEEHDDIELCLIEGVRYDAAMRLKATCDVLIDEVVTGSYHRCTLEGLALGIPTIVNVDAELVGVVSAITGCTDWFPWIQSDRSQLEDTLLHLRDAGCDRRWTIGAEGRRWMERYWHPRDIARDFCQQIIEGVPSVAEVMATTQRETPHAGRDGAGSPAPTPL